MRYPAEHKQQTRDRIVRAASRRFRRGGAGVGIAQLMKALKLTHGGFYRHFRNKDELLGEAFSIAFDDTRSHVAAAVAKAAPGRELAAIIERYLSEEHCANPAGGCPVASLASEVARQPRSVRQVMQRAITQVTSNLSKFMAGATEDERRSKAGVLFSGMSGTLAVARAMPDDDLRRKFLASARKIYIEAFAPHH